MIEKEINCEKKKLYFADLHIHSRFSRACSKDLNLETLEKWARVKGLDLLGTGDFTHPVWLKELKENLTERSGIFYTKKDFPFILTGEISLMYSDDIGDGKNGRKVHLVLLAPNFEAVDKINSWLDTKGRRDYDGRPIFKISCEDFTAKMKLIDDKIEVICAHSWTPHFGIFGSASGYNSLKDAFKSQEKNIHAIETGISSDRNMNFGINELKKRTIVSFSDSHCIHPESLITLKDGYVMPIKDIEKEKNLLCCNFNRFKCVNKKRNQFNKIKSPEFLKKIVYRGGEILVSNQHRFFVYENKRAVQKYAYELKEKDLLFRLFKIQHRVKKFNLKIPKSDTFYKLSERGLLFLKDKRNKEGLLQREIADKLGTTKDNYWKIENRKIKLNLIFLDRLSDIFNFNLDEVIDKYVVKSFSYKFPKEMSEDLSEFLGYLVGDGCYSIINRGQCLLLSDKNKALLEHYKKKIDALFSCSCRLSKCNYRNSYRLFIPSHVAKFIKLNFPEAVLKTADLKIPRKLFSAHLKIISAFLRGFFDAEGCVGHHYLDVCSSNKLLLYQIDSLLKKFGIFTTVSLNNLEKSKGKFRHRLFLYNENMSKFKKEINFNHMDKKTKLNKDLSSIKFPRRSKIKKKNNFILSEITSISNIKSDTKYLYDLSVTDLQNYIANQVVVHNSFWPFRLGREATIFSSIESYEGILKQIIENKILGTIEVEPAYGKYHFDGHRECGFSCSPEETKKLNGICPVCKKKLTIGVDFRVEELRNDNEKDDKIEFKILPLHEILSLSIGKGISSKFVWDVYNKLIKEFGNEFNVLLIVEKEKILDFTDDKTADLIIKNREGKIKIKPGYDGVYGETIISEEQKTLF